MIRVLHIMSAAGSADGIAAVVYNFYKYINKDVVHFDVALTTDSFGGYGIALQKLGVKFYRLPLKSNGIHKYMQKLETLLKKEHFDAIHVHENETSFVALFVAKKMGIPCRIAHAHTASPYESFKGEIKRVIGGYLNTYFSTEIIACGELSGQRIFGKHNMKHEKAYVLKNAVETDRFSYNPLVRQQVRTELKVENKVVLGMVGRIAPEKNTLYGVEVFEEIQKKCENALLMIVGDGPCERELLQVIQNKKLLKSVVFLGRREDVERFYQAFDVFLMPSLYEGFPVSAVEAMSSGLPLLLSNTVTRELEFGSAVNYLSLNDKMKWVNCAMKYQNDELRSIRQNEVKANGLEIKDVAKKLEAIYSKEK